MKERIETCVKKLLFGFVLILIMMIVQKSFGAGPNVEFTPRYFGTRIFYDTIRVKVVNPSNAPITFTPGGASTNFPLLGGGFFYGTLTSSDFGNATRSTAARSVNAGSFIYVTVKVETGHSSGHAQTYTTGQQISPDLKYSAGGIAMTHPLQFFATKIAYTENTTIYWNPTPIDIPDIYLALPPASGKVYVYADANAAGSRQWRLKLFNNSLGQPSEPFDLPEGGPTLIINSTTPNDFESGSWIQILQNVGSVPVVIGESAIIKDGFGNFSVDVTATGIPVMGKITVIGATGLTGDGRVTFTAPPGEYDLTAFNSNFLFDGSNNDMFTLDIDPASQIPAGTVVKVEFRQTGDGDGDWYQVGEAPVAKADDGSFHTIIQSQGEGDDPDPLGAAVFELDAVSYDASSKVVQLEIDGVLYTPENGQLGGDPTAGLRKKIKVVMPGDATEWHSKAYRWVISGSVDGVPVTQQTIASGVSPFLMADFTEPGFVAQSSATVGTPRNPDPDLPDNPFDPDATPPTDPDEAQSFNNKSEMYQAMRKAIEDAQAGVTANVSGGAGPDGKEGEGAAAGFGEAMKGLGEGAKGIGEMLGLGPVGTFGGIQGTYTIYLPVFGAAVLNLQAFQPFPGIIRLILTGWLAWVTSIAGVRIVRGAFGGK